MNFQIIKSIEGKPEYVLLPIENYNILCRSAEKISREKYSKDEYVSFELEDYIENPIALARIHRGLTQEQLAVRMKVTQAYISKLESQKTVTAKVLKKIKEALCNKK